MLIAQISDCHVTARRAGHPRLGDTAAFLVRAVDHLNRLRPRPDVVIATGDLCDPGSADDYALLRARISRLETPVYLIPGNHDDRDAMRSAFSDHTYLRQHPRFLQYVVDGFPLRLIGLDTIVPGADHGMICEERLAWIGDQLAAAEARPTFIFMHHPPAKIGLPFIDALDCRWGDALGALVSRHSNIAAVACGHVHRPVHLAWCGTTLVTSPSTCYQFPLAMDAGARIVPCAEPPACRLYLWGQGRLIVHTTYID